MLIILSVFAYGACPIVAGYLMRSYSSSLPACNGLVPGTCPVALEAGFSLSLYMGPISLFFMLIVLVGGCFLPGDQLMGDDGWMVAEKEGVVLDATDAGANEKSPLLSRK